jgi:hypothetical protein
VRGKRVRGEGGEKKARSLRWLSCEVSLYRIGRFDLPFLVFFLVTSIAGRFIFGKLFVPDRCAWTGFGDRCMHLSLLHLSL